MNLTASVCCGVRRVLFAPSLRVGAPLVLRARREWPRLREYVLERKLLLAVVGCHRRPQARQVHLDDQEIWRLR